MLGEGGVHTVGHLPAVGDVRGLGTLPSATRGGDRHQLVDECMGSPPDSFQDTVLPEVNGRQSRSVADICDFRTLHSASHTRQAMFSPAGSQETGKVTCEANSQGGQVVLLPG